MSSSSSQRRREPWRNVERHYCKICNAWMSSDRQSIMLHENGKKHIENVEKSLQHKRQEKQRQESQQNQLQAQLRQMEQAAMESHIKSGDFLQFGNASSIAPMVPNSSTTTGYSQAPPPPPPPVKSSTKDSNTAPTSSKRQWETARQEKKKQRRKDKHGGDNSDDDEENKPNQQRRRQKLLPGQGHYDVRVANNDQTLTYLEASTFFEVLEPDMPVQLWTGPILASMEEKRLPDREVHWKDALVVGIRRNQGNVDGSDPGSVTVAYLNDASDDEEETIEKNCMPSRIRIQLGGAHELIPDTLEEARILAMGGQDEEQVVVNDTTTTDEATGLSGWSAVSIKRTTARQERKEEAHRWREQRRQEQLQKESQAKQAEARRLEEAKVANADDSALGAYDIWGKGGYKGIDISNAATSGGGGDNNNNEVKIEDTIAPKKNSMFGGKVNVAFKKKKKPANRKQSRRTTSGDD